MKTINMWLIKYKLKEMNTASDILYFKNIICNVGGTKFKAK